MGWRVMGDGVIGKTKDDVVSLMAHHPSPNKETTMCESKTGFTGWAILELIGRRRMAGRVCEALVAGSAFIRLDVPHPNDATLIRASHFYSPAAVRSITPTSEEKACAIAWGERTRVIE